MTTENLVQVQLKYHDDIILLRDKFRDYMPVTVDEARITSWLSKFHPDDRALAIKLAHNVRYYSVRRMIDLMKELYHIIVKQVNAEGMRLKKAYFAPFGGVTTSGSGVMYRFSKANTRNLARREKQLVSVADLPEVCTIIDNPIVFFLDDFVGTGTQAVKYWNEVLKQLVPEYLRLYLTVIVACDEAVKRIEGDSPLKVLCVHQVPAGCYFYKSGNKQFSDDEKQVISKYCDRVGNFPKGFGDLGLTLSFAYATPNNSISILRGSKRQRTWIGLLPRSYE